MQPTLRRCPVRKWSTRLRNRCRCTQFYLQSRQPPMLKDYFNPVLHATIDAPRRVRHIRLQFGMEPWTPGITRLHTCLEPYVGT